MHAKTNIICLVHNGFSITRSFVDHLFKNTKNFNLIFVDNGSTDKVRGLLQHGNDEGLWKTVRSEVNLGVIVGRNLGVQHITNDYFVNIDNDQHVGAGWLQKLHDLMDKGYDIVGSEAWCLTPPSGSGSVVMEGSVHNRDYYPFKHCKRKGEKFTYIGCGGMLIKKEVFDNIEMFDERFSPAYYEDPDFCYDKDTHIYTNKGFVPFPDITEYSKILTKNEDGFFEYKKPNWIIKKFESHLLHFTNQQIDIKCTENQKLLVGYSRNAWRDIDKGKHTKPNFISAKDIAKKLKPRQTRYYIEKSGGSWVGVDKDINMCGMNLSLEYFAVFMAWYLSEGNICYDKDKRKLRGDYQITICQVEESNRQKYIPEIQKTISRMGFKTTVNSKGVSFCCKPLVEYLSQFGRCYEKRIPDSIKQSPTRIIIAFLETYLKGDGSVSCDGKKWSFSTSSTNMKNDLIELLVKCGRSFTCYYRKEGYAQTPSGVYYCRGVWQIQSYEKNIAYLPPPKTVLYNDYVYDVNIDNNRILIMRNGKSCWSSNCFRAIQAGYKLGWLHNCPITHLAHQTIGSQKLFSKNTQFLKSWKLFQEKWRPYFPNPLQTKD